MKTEYTNVILENMRKAGMTVKGSFTRQDIQPDLDRLIGMTNNEQEAAKIYMLAIEKAGSQGWKTWKSISTQIDEWLLWDLLNYDEVLSHERKQVEPVKKRLPANETVPDWDNQKVVQVSQEELDIQRDRFAWMKDVEIYHSNKEIYKHIRTFPKWQEWNKKRAISGG